MDCLVFSSACRHFVGMNMHVPTPETPEDLMLAMGARARAAAKAVREASAQTRSAAHSRRGTGNSRG
jgi:carbonic anhydrase/acetyltransferase-like protein (isoleucine patch superfamily)